MPNVSIIITTHDRPHLLPNAIRSARAAARDAEIIVVDDASCDETAAVCYSIAGIIYVRVDRNQGVAGARNIGLIASSGEYITFLDDDDARLPDSIDLQIRVLEKNPQAAFVYGQAIAECGDDERREAFPLRCPQGDIFWQLLARNFIPCGCVVFKRSVVSAIGLLDDAIAGIDDWDFWIRIAEIFPGAAVEAPVMIWRQSTPTSTQGTSNTVEIIAMASRHFRSHFAKLPRFATASRKDQRRAWRDFSMSVSEHLAWEIFSGARAARFGHAIRSLRTLLALHPAVFTHFVRRWMNRKTLVTLAKSATTSERVANTKLHFKSIRSNTVEQ